MGNKGEYFHIDVEMRTLSPLFTGEIKGTKAKGVKPVRKSSDGRVVVPIYGALRAGIERSLRASGEQVCDSGKKACGQCVVCSLFGSLSQGGRAVIDDIVSDEPASKIAHASNHVRLNRETNTVEDSLKQEEVEEGAVFRGRILVDRPDDRDIELLQTGVEAVNEFGLGGWRTRGRGKVEISLANVEKRRWEDFKEEGSKKARELLSS